MVTSPARLSAPDSAYARKTRARILSAAERRFRHYGFAKTTIVDIAGDCAMSHANVYRFFANKTELVDVIAEGWLGKSERICREVARRPIAASERLVGFVVELHRWKLREYQRDTRTHELLALASHEGHSFVSVHLSVLADILVEIIADGNRAREFVVRDPRRLARVIQHATVKFCDPRLLAQYHDEPLEEQARDVMRVLLGGIAAM